MYKNKAALLWGKHFILLLKDGELNVEQCKIKSYKYIN